MQKLVDAVEKKQYSCGVFLEFAKAFDTVNDKILNKETRPLWYN